MPSSTTGTTCVDAELPLLLLPLLPAAQAGALMPPRPAFCFLTGPDDADDADDATAVLADRDECVLQFTMIGW